jgi:hypothetical protein
VTVAEHVAAEDVEDAVAVAVAVELEPPWTRCPFAQLRRFRFWPE